MTSGRVLVSASRLLSVLGVIVVVALLPWLSGRDPALSILRARSADQEPTPAALAAIRADLGLDAGPITLLRQWFGRVLRGDLGTSWNTGRPVLPGALDALAVSTTLMGFALAVACAVATVIVAPALRAGLRGRPSRSSGVGASVLTSVPEFLLASVAVIVGSVWLSLPSYGWTGPTSAILPALALGLPAGGLLGRLLADAVSVSFTEAWVTTWTAADVDRGTLARAVLRRAASSLTSQMALVMVGLLGGAVAVERVFAIPGIGRSMLGNAQSQDLPALQTDILLLMGVSVLIGVAAQAARRALLGRSVHDRAVPVPTARVAAGRFPFVVPAVAASALGIMVLVGLPRDPFATTRGKFLPPSLAHPFGTDASGRDVLARVAHGAAHTVTVSATVALGCVLVGLVLGSAARVFTGPIEVTNAAPPVIAGVIVASVVGPGAAAAAVAVLSVSWAPLAAHTAALSAEVAARPYVAVLPTLGAGRLRVLFGSVLPAVGPAVLRHGVLRLPGIALALAALGFLGLGPQPPSPDWGLVLADGVSTVERAPWVALAPLASLVLLAVTAVSLSSAVRSRRGRRPTADPAAQADRPTALSAC
ncbi:MULTISPECIES: ABC transporter permease subunit [Nocardiaceae]|uniref:Peptide/nickel transport system permease protein n=1 Tax=Rhodococcoides corynebacterioides TaxID=53972 RepID=A0ABS2KPJ3_9NOCA|nr:MULTISPECIES: ABC transporter permease subunit [Rhodococcus]MBM7413894.1 peptide/nickel transport system permease protein [Rhodococcus corynebacterioides]MBP1116357.1 peptide/nickel transport system permease protein [Rhodococcus sp. PvP016]